MVFRNGEREGIRKVWHDNGQLMKFFFYHDGIEQGENKEWYEDGNLRHYVYYQNGRIVDETFSSGN